MATTKKTETQKEAKARKRPRLTKEQRGELDFLRVEIAHFAHMLQSLDILDRNSAQEDWILDSLAETLADWSDIVRPSDCN